jgi:mycothiol system anti-sigma-R factor
MKIECQDFAPFIDAYLDGEFAEREQIEFETHLEHCDACRAEVESRLELRETFRACLSSEEAPDELREHIMAGLDEISCGADEPTPEPTAAAPSWRSRAALALAPLAACAALVFLVSNFTTIAPATSEPPPVIEQTVEWHRGNFPIEVEDSDPREISGWFRGRVDFPVRLPHFSARDVSLQGARLAHVQDRRAAYVHYEVDGHKLSVMMFHGDGLKVPSDKIRSVDGRDFVLMNNHGYDVALVQDGGITYTMTSELPEDRFLSIVESSLARRAPQADSK